MFTRQHQMISGDCIFPFYVFFRYRKHILYQKCALTAVIQSDNMENITRFPGFFLFLHNPPVFINTAGQRYHPVYPGTCIFKTIIMRSVSCLISFEIRVWHIFKKSVLNKNLFSSFACPHYGKVPRLAAKDYTFNPTIYIPRIGQR